MKNDDQSTNKPFNEHEQTVWELINQCVGNCDKAARNIISRQKLKMALGYMTTDYSSGKQ